MQMQGKKKSNNTLREEKQGERINSTSSQAF